MKLGIVLYSDDTETVFQAFRLGCYALEKGDEVRMFLLARGVECEGIDDDRFKVTEQIQAYLDAGGETFSCGSCMKMRKMGATEVCSLSTMGDLYDIVVESDKVVTF